MLSAKVAAFSTTCRSTPEEQIRGERKRKAFEIPTSSKNAGGSCVGTVRLATRNCWPRFRNAAMTAVKSRATLAPFMAVATSRRKSAMFRCAGTALYYVTRTNRCIAPAKYFTARKKKPQQTRETIFYVLRHRVLHGRRKRTYETIYRLHSHISSSSLTWLCR